MNEFEPKTQAELAKAKFQSMGSEERAATEVAHMVNANIQRKKFLENKLNLTNDLTFEETQELVALRGKK